MSAPDLPLFDRAMTPTERRKMFRAFIPKKGLYAAIPGTGPEGETCRSCAHKAYMGGCAGHYIKCGLMRDRWTRGGGTDIKAGSSACAKWEIRDK
jgi:hypothetical protein